MAIALGTGEALPQELRAIIDKARGSWLKNEEILEVLENQEACNLPLCGEAPTQPEGGQLFLFDKNRCRRFRNDGHNWRKKPDNKTVRETHEKLKVGNLDALNCYYAHTEGGGSLQRRCYWQLLENHDHIVLVHYLNCASSRASGLARGNSAEQAATPTAASQRPQRTQRGRAHQPQRSAEEEEEDEQESSEGGEVQKHGGGGGGRMRPAATLSPHLLPQQQPAAVVPNGLPRQPSMGAALVRDISLPAGFNPQQGGMLSLQAQWAAASEEARAAASAQIDALALAGLPPAPGGLPPAPAHHRRRSSAGLLFVPERLASHLAAGGSFMGGYGASGLTSPTRSISGLMSPTRGASGLMSPPRGPHHQSTLSAEHHPALFRQMSLGIGRGSHDEGDFRDMGMLLSPTSERSLDINPSGSGDGTSTSGGGLSGLLASPPHPGAAMHSHNRSHSFARQGSGLSRLISKNWEADMQMDCYYPDSDVLSNLDADVSQLPVMGPLDPLGAAQPSSPNSRVFAQAGITFLGSAAQPVPFTFHGGGGAQAALLGSGGAPGGHAHQLAPSPLGVPAEGAQPGSLGRPHLNGAEEALQVGSLQFGSPLCVGLAAAVEFHSGSGGAAARAPLSRISAASVPRVGSHASLTVLAARRAATSSGEEAGADSSPHAAAAAARRQQQLAAAQATQQEHRAEALQQARHRRTTSQEQADLALLGVLAPPAKHLGAPLSEEPPVEMIEEPGGEAMLRLRSFLGRGSGSADREAAAAAARQEVAEEGRLAYAPPEVVTGAGDMDNTRRLFRNMSIDEADVTTAMHGTIGGGAGSGRALEVMPSIPAMVSGELGEGTLLGSLPGSQGGSLPGSDVPSRDHSVSSLMGHLAVAGTPPGLSPASQDMDPLGAQLAAALAMHTARQSLRR